MKTKATKTTCKMSDIMVGVTNKETILVQCTRCGTDLRETLDLPAAEVYNLAAKHIFK